MQCRFRARRNKITKIVKINESVLLVLVFVYLPVFCCLLEKREADGTIPAKNIPFKTGNSIVIKPGENQLPDLMRIVLVCKASESTAAQGPNRYPAEKALGGHAPVSMLVFC